MKRLIKQSSEDYIGQYGVEQMGEIAEDVGSWISGGRGWFDNPDETVKKWMEMFPSYIYSGQAFRLLAFSESELIAAINQTFNINIENLNDVNDDLSSIIISNDNIQNISNILIQNNNDYVSWTKNEDKHNEFHNFYRDFNGDDDFLFSIKSNVTGFYVTEFNLYLEKAINGVDKEEYDEISLKYDGVKYSDQDEIIAPSGDVTLNMINEINVSELIGLDLFSFINKLLKK